MNAVAPACAAAALVLACAASAVSAAPAAIVATPASADARTPGDPANGERVYARCQACHALAYDRTGPRHCGLLGRRAGSVPGFPYSEAMKRSGIVWNEQTLDRFLADPLGTVPGTTMGYAGVADARERADLIAFLRRARCAQGAAIDRIRLPQRSPRCPPSSIPPSAKRSATSMAPAW